MDVSRATNHLGSIFTCNIAFDVDAENHHFESCPNLPDESLLKRHPYFVVRLNAVHAIRFGDLINDSQSVEIPVAVAAYLDKWLVIPRHVFFAKEPSIIRNVLFSMGVTRDLIDYFDYFAPRISSFFAAMAEIPRHTDYRIMPLALTAIPETPYRESEIELAIRESLAAVRTVPATRASIDSLKDVKNIENISALGASTTQECCMICLEELLFSADVADGHEQDDHKEKVVSMPCSHLYHKDCIVQWLETSHFYPLCRYAMPSDLS